MDIKDLNKSQLILLAILLSFVTSIATGITTVTLMDQAPTSVTVPINRIVRETVNKIVPVEVFKEASLTSEQKKILQDLKAIQPLTVSLYLKGAKVDGSEDEILATGLFLGENKVIIAKIVVEPKEGEIYVIKSLLGEKNISKITSEKDFTIIELEEDAVIAPPFTEEKTTSTKEEIPTTVTPPN